MVRDYKRRERDKQTYQAYTTESLEQCLQNVTNGNLSMRKAAERFTKYLIQLSKTNLRENTAKVLEGKQYLPGRKKSCLCPELLVCAIGVST